MKATKTKLAIAAAATAGAMLTSTTSFAQSLGEGAKGSTVTGTKVKAYGEATYVSVEGSLAQTVSGKGKVGIGPVGLEGGYQETKGATTGQIDNGIVDIQGSTVTNSEFDVNGKLSNAQAKAGGTLRNGSAYVRN